MIAALQHLQFIELTKDQRMNEIRELTGKPEWPDSSEPTFKHTNRNHGCTYAHYYCDFSQASQI